MHGMEASIPREIFFMNFDLTPFFAEYEALAAQTDALFQRVSGDFSAEVKCCQGCSDCCHALFDVTLVEALYLNAKFLLLDEALRNEILIAADKADRRAHVLKKKASREAEERPHEEILTGVAKERLRCPLLDQNNQCRLYAFRPVTCRVYGIPLEIGGASRTCGLSGFAPGRAYPAVKLEHIQDRLLGLSNRLLDALGSPYPDFRMMYVPVSTALMTVYSNEYFGLGSGSGQPNTVEAKNA